MYFTDFTYDGTQLSTLGYMVCTFGNASGEDISNGSKLDFTTVAQDNGRKYSLANSQYSECITATFSICKNPCAQNYTPAMSVADISKITAWLNRKQFKKFKINATDFTDIFFEGSFNISRVEYGGETIGLNLELITNRPFALKEEVSTTLSFSANQERTINFTTDEIGDIYPKMIVTFGANSFGLTVKDSNNNVISTTSITSVTSGNTRTLEYPMIYPDSNIDGFNFEFPKFRKSTTNTYDVMKLTASTACSIVIKYNPVVRISI